MIFVDCEPSKNNDFLLELMFFYIILKNIRKSVEIDRFSNNLFEALRLSL